MAKTKQKPPIITPEEAANLEMAYGKVLAHLKQARTEIEAMRQEDTLGVMGYFRFIEEGTEADVLYYAWRKIILRHPLMERLDKVAPMKVEGFLWSIGLSNSPPITQDTIMWVMEQIEERRGEIEAHI